MTNILGNIIDSKRREVSERRSRMPYRGLELSPLFSRSCLSLSATLQEEDRCGLIAEFKRKSPSKGFIHADADPARVAAAYARGGAAAISVLTDGPFFGGSLSDLTQVRQTVQLPVLRKDFIIDEYQVIEAKSAGADLILLIAAVLSSGEIKSLSDLAHSLGLEVLLEVHDASELRQIPADIALIGVNNRNLYTFETDLQTSLDLVEKLPAGKIWVSESGIRHAGDIRLLADAGFRAFLVGESLMKKDDPGQACADLTRELGAANPLYLP